MVIDFTAPAWALTGITPYAGAVVVNPAQYRMALLGSYNGAPALKLLGPGGFEYYQPPADGQLVAADGAEVSL